MNSPALKEWGAAVQALLDGRQTVLLRKGGIHEKRFALTARQFVFFPTVAHGHAETTQEGLAPREQCGSACDGVGVVGQQQLETEIRVGDLRGGGHAQPACGHALA